MNSKELIFLRHAVAAERESWEGPDEERPLTKEGQEKMIRGSRGLKKILSAPEAILSSPLVRARQTAEIVQAAFPHLSIEIEEDLKPGGLLASFLKKIRRSKERRILLVGHEPAMSEWILNLLGSRLGGSVRLKKGGCSLLEVDLDLTPPRAELIFLLPPKVLRQLGS